MTGEPAMPSGNLEGMERRSGVALWRQIADRIRSDIAATAVAEGGQLPPETSLAQRFGVNRHTVRTAIAALVQEGTLRAEQGRGTFVERTLPLSYPIGKRTRFSTGLEGQTRNFRSILLSSGDDIADGRLAVALDLKVGAPLSRLETLGEADGRPLSRSTNWFDAQRFHGIATAFDTSGSMTAALRTFGVDDYIRKSTTVSARHADAADLDDLKLSNGAIVIVTRAVNADMDGRVIQYAETRFAADRVELTIGS
jgi:GntR family phosphonate transport system transcriptional regulator